MLRRRRVAAGLTLRQFAAAAYVSAATASRWETGKRRPHADQMNHVADVLGLEIDCLVAALDAAPPRLTDTMACPGLRALRESVGMSRRSFASRLSVSVATVAHWECDRRRLPRARLASVADALAVPLQTLEHRLGRAPAGPPVGLLRQLRLRAGVTQARAARALGVTPSTISGYERGVREVPYRHIRRLAVVYEQSIPAVAQAVGQVAVPHPSNLDYDRIPAAAVIQTLRAWHSVTRTDLARRSGLHPQTIRRWEEGAAVPTAQQLSVLEPVLGLAPGRLQRSPAGAPRQ